MSAKINVFLSDIHIGSNRPTNWYLKDVHQKYLKAILKHIQDNGENIKDFVILGDWFDFWMYPPAEKPPCISDIFDANKDIFYPSGDGDFVSCLDSIQGDFYYINGNHDLNASCEEINIHFKNFSKKGKMIVCDGSENNNTYKSGRIYAEHGHRYSLTCRRDVEVKSYSPLPLGYYISRTVALLCQQKLQKEGLPNAAMLPDSGNPVFSFESVIYDLAYIAKLLAGETTFAEAILFDLISKSGQKDPEKIIYTMPDDSTINARQVADMFSHLKIKTDVWHDSDLKADIEDSLGSKAGHLANRYRVVVLGHTHTPKLDVKKISPRSVYANTGFGCASKPDMEKSLSSPPIFIEVEEKEGEEKYKVRWMGVDYPACTISKKHEKSAG